MADKRRVAPGVYKAGTGSYLIRINVPDVDGRQRKVSRVVHGTREEAKAERGKMLAALNDGTLALTRNTVVRDLRTKVMDMKRATLADASIDFYDYVWKLIDPEIGDIPIAKLTNERLDDAYLAVRKQVGPTTTNSVHKHVFSILEQAVVWQVLHRNVARSTNRKLTEKAPVDIVPPSESRVMLFFEEAKDYSMDFATLVYFLAATGLRRGEVAGLRWFDIDFDDEIVHVQHQPDVKRPGELRTVKGKRSRQVPIDEDVVELLQAHRERAEKLAAAAGGTIAEDTYVFSPEPGNTTAYRPDGITWRFRHIVAKAKLDRITPHQLRHFRASLLNDRGVPLPVIQELLGHADIGVTRTYTHTTPKQKKRATAAARLNR